CLRPRPASATPRATTTRGAGVLALPGGAPLAGLATAGPPAVDPGACVAPRSSAAYAARVPAALESRRDLWGEQLLRSPAGPTLAGASGRLAPLLYARAAGRRPLTG